MVKLITGINDLATLRPDLAAQWHPTKNGTITPQLVTCGSNVKAWWICPLGHEWDSTVDSRTRGDGCPICSGHRVLKGFNDLATVNPELAKQWHPTKNGDKTPEMFSKGSREKICWVCPLGHEWFATIDSRSRGYGCPICSGHQVLVGFNDLATVNPELASQWHPTKNGNLTPDMYTCGSNEKAWWMCPLGHEWNAIINSRSQGSGCPYCNSESKTSFPEQAIFYYLKQIDNTIENRKKINGKWEVDIWLPSKNIAIEYDGVYYHVGKQNKKREIKKNIYLEKHKIRLIRIKESLAKNINVVIKNNIIKFSIKNNYFQLNEVVEKVIKIIFNNIQTTINLDQTRVKILESYKQNCLNNSLAALNPELAKEWHPTKNGTLTPEMFTVYSGQNIWWICSKGHEWQATIASRSQGNGCPFCSGRNVIKSVNDLATLSPDLISQWHPTKNGDLTSDKVTAHSGQKAWWVCPLGHEWESTIASRSNGGGCPICAGKQVLKGFNDLATVNPELASQWHPTKNGNNTPEMFTKGSHQLTWWTCPKGHEWQATIDARSRGNGCPICDGKQTLIGYNDLATLRPDLALQWHPTKNGDLTPQMVTAHSGQKVWWICPLGHEWEDTIAHRSDGRGCPICSGKRVLIGYNDLATVNPELASQWHPTKNGDLKPTDVTQHSGKTAWWKCPKGHSWESTINNRSKGSGCPICSKTNRKHKKPLI